MTGSPLEVRELRPAEWWRLREVRLAALQDSPAAYTSSYEQEAGLGEAEWRDRFGTTRWVVAEDGGHVIGLAGLVSGQEPDGERHIESAWVAPSHRRRGVLRSLVDYLAEIGRGARSDTLFLWVVGDNHVARRAYMRLGFVPTGEAQALEPDNGRIERRLRLDVRS